MTGREEGEMRTRCESRLQSIDPTEVLAVADGEDDLDMLVEVGVDVAVRGGADAAIAAADELIDGPEVGGWAEVPEMIDRT